MTALSRRFAASVLVLLMGMTSACAEATSPQPTPSLASTATAAPSVAPTATAEPTPTLLPVIEAAQLDRHLREEYPNFSGAILVAQRGAILISEGYGLADRAQGIANTPETRFGIGSMTKPFTAMAIMMLYEEGRLRVDDSICDYLPECPPGWSPITLHHLLTHTSGLYNYTDLVYPVPKPGWDACQPTDPLDIVAGFADHRLIFAPGDRWQYSNSNYLLLGIVIEAVSGMPYDAFIAQRIFTPLGMTGSGYDIDRSGDVNRALGYRFAPSEGQIVPSNCFDAAWGYAAGALYSTVGDLYRWDQAFSSEALVSTDTLGLILSAAEDTPDDTLYGYGWEIGEQDGHRMIFHGGGLPGYTGMLRRYPDDQLTVVVLMNQETALPLAISESLARLVLTGGGAAAR